MRQTRVIVIGAGGNLGRRLVSRGLARGHLVTAFVRDAGRFAAGAAGAASPDLRIVEGDASDAAALAAALRDQDAAVSAAGNVADGAAFSALFASVVAVVERELPPPGRFWAVAGAAALTIPFADRIGVGLPGVPALYRPHERNWRTLAASATDWSLMCPGPMVAAPDGAVRTDLRVSVDILPYRVPRWAGWVPGIGLSLLMKSRLPELIVSYEDFADIIMAHLAPGGPYSRHRVGVALPAGERGRKDDWTLGSAGGSGQDARR